MGISGGPDLVENGIIFMLDASTSLCFQSGSTTATDLIQGFNCSGASGTPLTGSHTPDPANFPSYNPINGGVFDFTGGKGINIDQNLGSSTTTSLCSWFYKTSTSSEYIFDGRNDGGTYFFLNYLSYNINWSNLLTYNFSGTYNASDPLFLNQWHFMIATSDDTGSKLYIDGREVTTTSSSSIDEDFGINYRIGTRYTTTNEWTGYMGPIYFYNRVLSSNEVLQNYNAQKSRFNLK
jgi:hypothetical protein